MRVLNLIILLFISLSLAGEEGKKEQITQLTSKWKGKQIIFPENLVFTNFTTDTADTTNYKIYKSGYKILIYVDSIACTSYRTQLTEWGKLIQNINLITNKEIQFLFFFHSNNIKEIQHLLKQGNFDIPVCIDISDKLNKQNKFPNNTKYHTFLLDNNNKITAIGNPVYNIKIKEIYLKHILGNKVIEISRQRTSLTKIISDSTEYDMGVVINETVQEKKSI